MIDGGEKGRAVRTPQPFLADRDARPSPSV